MLDLVESVWTLLENRLGQRDGCCGGLLGTLEVHVVDSVGGVVSAL